MLLQCFSDSGCARRLVTHSICGTKGASTISLYAGLFFLQLNS